MAAPTTAFSFTCTTASLQALEVDLLVIPWFEDDRPDAFGALDQAVGGEIGRVLASKEFVARPFELCISRVIDGAWRPRRVMLFGAGRRERFHTTVARQVATAAALGARQRRIEHLGLLLRPAPISPGSEPDVVATAQAIAEGLQYAEFDGGCYKTMDAAPAWQGRFVIALSHHDVSSGLSAVEKAVARGRVLGECTNMARTLANEPGNRLTPRTFAERAAECARGAGVAVEILDERQIADLGMGLLLGVAQGSIEPPRLIVFRHEPAGAPEGPVLGLIGKGVTFDSGGISIKPADGMDRMKDDMSGGAAVACAMRAIALLGAPIRVIGIVPAVENMPGGRAVKPGDVLTSAEGKTVEVLNTDAEGRLILGDSLWYARKLGATHLVDVATLTGAVIVALGKVASGIFGTPDAWVEHVRQVSNRAGDRMWPLPLYDEYRELIKSEIADFTNTGGRAAGSATAAMFLKEFTGDLPWAHMDIAGTAWVEEPKPYLPKGPSGVAVRALAELAFTSDAWPR